MYALKKRVMNKASEIHSSGSTLQVLTDRTVNNTVRQNETI